MGSRLGRFPSLLDNTLLFLPHSSVQELGLEALRTCASDATLPRRFRFFRASSASFGGEHG